MATVVAPVLAPGTSFDLNQGLIDKGILDGKGAVSVSVTALSDPTVLQKIATNAPLGSDEFTVAQCGAQAKASLSCDSDIRFLKPGKVSFSGAGNAYASFGIYPDPTGANFKNAISPIDNTGLALQRDANLTWCTLRWGAGEDATGNGSIALAPANSCLTFSGQEHGEMFFAVLRQFPRTTPTGDALAAVVQSWRLPAQVKTDADLEPGTYLLAELAGSLNVNLDVTFGHAFNWVRQTTIGDLTGDIGLKLQLGLETTLGFCSQGKYAVVVSRESLNPASRTVRVRIYRLKSSEFDFALSLAAAATLKLPVPKDYHDLLEAALGVHGVQILKKLESWTDPNCVPEILQKLGDKYVSGFLQKVTGLSGDQAKTAMSAFISKWNNLPHEAASFFAKEAARAIPDFSGIKSLATAIANQDHDSFVQALSPLLSAGFEGNPALQWLETIAPQCALTLVQDVPGFQNLQKLGQSTLDFLNGNSVEQLLTNLLTEVENRTGLQSILNLSQNNFAGMDALLQSRLTDFLDKVPGFGDIKTLQTTVSDLLANNKIAAFYTKAVDALTKTYTAQFNVSYQSTASDNALLDVSFDFLKGSSVRNSLADLLAGNLDDILSKPLPGVNVNSGTLTHTLKRISHVDLTLPCLITSRDWVRKATASFNVVDQDNGRLCMCHMDATSQTVDKNSIFSGRNWRSTTLALTSNLPQDLAKASGIMLHSANTLQQDSATALSSFRFEAKKMTRSDLYSTVAPAAMQFLPKAFPTSAAFERWADLGHLLATPANAIVSLDVSIPPRVPLAWLRNAPAAGKDPRYMEMSKRIQTMIKKLLPQYIFRDLAFYENIDASSAVLLYQSMRPATSITVDGNRVTFTADDVYWDFEDDYEFDAMKKIALSRLGPVMDAAHQRLISAGCASKAKFYSSADQTGRRFTDATQGLGLADLLALLKMERWVVNKARAAGLEIAQFNRTKQTSPTEAIKHLAHAGELLASAFNQELDTPIVGDGLMRLAPLIFADAAIAFDPAIGGFTDDAVLNVTVLKPGATLPDCFPDFKIDDKDILISLNAQDLSMGSAGSVKLAHG